MADRTPAPAGGGAAAICGAAAAALVQMTAAFARGRHEDTAADALRARAGALRSRLLELAEEDARSYRPVLDALAMAPGDTRRAQALAAALGGASDVPLQIAEAAAEVAALADGLSGEREGSALAGDAAAAAAIARGAAAAAASLVLLNLAASPGDPRRAAAEQIAARAAAPS